jgi:hypothetical protein
MVKRMCLFHEQEDVFLRTINSQSATGRIYCPQIVIPEPILSAAPL